VEHTSDQNKLAQIAIHISAYGPYDETEVGIAAINKINDQLLLTEVATNAACRPIRFAAIEKITDQAALIKIAESNADGDERVAAIENITDQSLLLKIVMNESGLCRIALEQLSDQTALAKVAVNARECMIRKDAVWKLTDQAVLAQIAMQDAEHMVRSTAVDKLTSPSLLLKVSFESDDPLIREESGLKLRETNSGKATVDIPTENRAMYLYSQIWNQLQQAIDAAPEHQRSRLYRSLLSVFHMLIASDILADLGGITDTLIRWEPRTEKYTAQIGHKRYLFNGESVTVSIKLEDLNQDITLTWSTEFPSVTGFPNKFWFPAEIEVLDFFQEISEYLSEGSADRCIHDANLLFPNAHTWEIQNDPTVFDRVRNPDLLVKIALNANNANVRTAAVKKLTDPAVLTMVSTQDDNIMVRNAANKRLADIQEEKLRATVK
jgi:hypothetical protein